MITIVTGLARCGTSLMMEMLHHGGMCVHADNFMSYESEDANGLPERTEWLDDIGGHAVKVIDPHANRLPFDRAYRFLWMHRDYKEQARSQIKFMRKSGRHVNGGNVQGLASLLEDDTRRIVPWLRAYPLGRLHVVRFERLIRRPRLASKDVNDFLGSWLDVDAMSERVVDRPVRCLNYMLEVDRYGEQR